MSSPATRSRRARRLLVVAAAALLWIPAAAGAEDHDAGEEIQRPPTLGLALDDLRAPAIAEPAWITESALPPVKREVRFRVTSTGAIESDLDRFAEAVQVILNDPRGWRGAGYFFTRVEDGPADVTVVLASPEGVTSFGPPCSAAYSCRSGDDVIINDERWRTATSAWNEAEASLGDYRRMVVNHEMGHWLGHGHYSCETRGEPAPLMQQQSKSLQGCEPNPWPLEFELASVTR